MSHDPRRPSIGRVLFWRATLLRGGISRTDAPDRAAPDGNLGTSHRFCSEGIGRFGPCESCPHGGFAGLFDDALGARMFQKSMALALLYDRPMPALDQYFNAMVAQGASDLHLSSANYPMFRLSGTITAVGKEILTADAG